MPEILLLDQNTINHIAAGEVVDRPLNVVKELVENAIDAGASAISVEIKDGGISMIRVTDNGCGIEANQISTAFLRHATSKIKSVEDLDCILSLGFRGEALSSICAVSQVELITKTQQQLTGVHFVMEGGVEKYHEEIGAPTGTTFIIRNLFFNTPARKKFLKSPQTEGSYIGEMMEHLALSRADISIKFTANGKVRFFTSGNGDIKDVIYRIYGKDTTDRIIPFEYETAFIKIKGFLGKPELNRANRSYEIFFVNHRYVRNDMISKAIEEGYHEYLMQHKFPFCVLMLEFDPKDIDVNVHPSKMEIRIHNQAEVYASICESIAHKFHEYSMIPNITLVPPVEEKTSFEKMPEPFENKRTNNHYFVSETVETIDEQPACDVGNYVENKIKSVTELLGDRKIEKVTKSSAEAVFPETIQIRDVEQISVFSGDILSVEAKKRSTVLGQIFKTYWLIEYDDKLYIMDQHAAHEKVNFERLMKALKNREVSSQNLYPPIVLSLPMKENEVLSNHMEHFTSLGFELEEFGINSYRILAVPQDLFGCNALELFKEVLDEILSNPFKSSEQPDVIRQKIASMSCKAAVKGNNNLSFEEVGALLDELLTLDNPYNCPHGRPTIISMSKYEFDRKFKRIVD